MVGMDLRQEQSHFVRTLYNQGILDNNFYSILAIRNGDNSRFAIEMLSMFTNDGQSYLDALERNLNEQVLDHPKVMSLVRQLGGVSSSVGGPKLAHACGDLQAAIDVGGRETYFAVFNNVKEEFRVLKENLDHFLLLERTILSNDERMRIRRRPGEGNNTNHVDM